MVFYVLIACFQVVTVAHFSQQTSNLFPLSLSLFALNDNDGDSRNKSLGCWKSAGCYYIIWRFRSQLIHFDVQIHNTQFFWIIIFEFWLLSVILIFATHSHSTYPLCMYICVYVCMRLSACLMNIHNGVCVHFLTNSVCFADVLFLIQYKFECF